MSVAAGRGHLAVTRWTARPFAGVRSARATSRDYSPCWPWLPSFEAAWAAELRATAQRRSVLLSLLCLSIWFSQLCLFIHLRFLVPVPRSHSATSTWPRSRFGADRFLAPSPPIVNICDLAFAEAVSPNPYDVCMLLSRAQFSFDVLVAEMNALVLPWLQRAAINDGDERCLSSPFAVVESPGAVR